MPRLYAVIEHDAGYSPDDPEPKTFGAYAEAARWLMERYAECQAQDFVVTPIVNGSFAYYKKGEDGEDGWVISIQPLLDPNDKDYDDAQ